MKIAGVTARDELAACYEDYALVQLATTGAEPDIQLRRKIRTGAYMGADFMQNRKGRPRLSTARTFFLSNGYDMQTASLMAESVFTVGREYQNYAFAG